VLATLPTATTEQTVFSVTNLVILIVVAAVFYPLQKKLRETVSRRRRERWEAEERDAQREQGDGPQAPDDLA
jgi:flagellar biosynthesis/type III secretory pathway M-ring protein FliF/YscJ